MTMMNVNTIHTYNINTNINTEATEKVTLTYNYLKIVIVGANSAVKTHYQ